MKRGTGIILTSMLVSTQVFATMTPTIERGTKNIYHTSPNGVQEVCIIPARYPGAKYKKKDLKKELELCNLSFYPVSQAEMGAGKETAALCAKENSTNPAINIYETTAELTKTAIEANSCRTSAEDQASKVGKYKNSTSCSYTPSIVGYYHVSRILGGIGRVPVSVLRTMDVITHKKLAAQGLALTKKGTTPEPLIYQTWSGLNSILQSGLGHAKKDLVLTDDGKQSYGAFIVNPKHEEFAKELFNKGTDRAAAFRDGNDYFELVRSSKDLNELVSSHWNEENVQKLVTMKDVTEFILLDHILDQQDRFGNIAQQERVTYVAKEDIQDTSFDLEMDSDDKDYKNAASKGTLDTTKAPLKINSMILKDNDCGVSKSNVVKQAGLLKLVRHMNPKTYKNLLEFQASLNANKKFFTSGLMFTETDFKELMANVDDAVGILRDNCKAGKLKLDLDIEKYLTTGALSNGSCEL